MGKMNLLTEMPYNEKGLAKRKAADTPEVLLMQIALLPGKSVPVHKANSNVHVYVLFGEIDMELNGNKESFSEGDLMRVEYGTEMFISNPSAGESAFMVIKTPHPSEFVK